MAIYTDLNSYTAKKKPLLKDIESVYQALNNLLSTSIGERIFLPEYGTALDSILFELIDKITSMEIYRFIIDAIARWEPRVRINYGQSKVIPMPEEKKYDISLVFSILGFEGQQYNFKGEIRK